MKLRQAGVGRDRRALCALFAILGCTVAGAGPAAAHPMALANERAISRPRSDLLNQRPAPSLGRRTPLERHSAQPRFATPPARSVCGSLNPMLDPSCATWRSLVVRFFVHLPEYSHRQLRPAEPSLYDATGPPASSTLS